MAKSAENFIKLANFYNQMTTIISAICVQKGGIAMENYVGRFFAADTLEFIAEYGKKLISGGATITPELRGAIEKFAAAADGVRDLVTPTQKPIYEMTLEEFEKVMNI
jgi:hypothetical protein